MNTAARARARYVALAVLSPLCLLALWVLATGQGWVKSALLPPPQAVLVSLGDMLAQGSSGIGLGVHVAASLSRVGMAFLFGALLGVALGLLRGRVPAIDALLLVPAEMLRPIPPLGLIPLFILWFGIGELSKVLLIFLSVFLIMMVNAHAGARSCPADLLRAAQSLGASRWQVFLRVVFPAALPQITTGLRVAMGTGFSILVASELLGGDRGLGFIILDASNFFRTTYVFAGIVLIGAIGLASDRLIAWAGRRIVHWDGQR
jgi:NitT/TauT family transport system permease protein/taurine transport system permease protein